VPARLRSLLLALFRRRHFEDAMAEEVRFHLEQYTEELVASGLRPDEAARRARLEFGTVDSVKEDCRQARGLRVFDDLQQDLRLAWRRLRKTPSFTLTALATLALCIGANLAIFAVVDAILLRPLPFPDPDRLVRIFNTYPKAGVPDDGCSVTNYYERRGGIAAFEALSAYREGTAIVGEVGATEREPVTRVSPEFFTTLGRGPTLGRAFTDEETTYETDAVAILTDAYWRQRLGADPAVIGRTIRVDGVSRTVVGVLAPDFRFLSSRARLYFPFSSNLEDRLPSQRHSGGGSSQMIARLMPGTTLAEAQAQVDMHGTAKEAADGPEAKAMADAGFRTLVVPLHADHVGSIRPTLLLVQGGALCLLLIGGVNLTNLLLIRASTRVKELAVRQAIGASRRHVVSAVVVETTLLTFMGGLLGLVVGAGGIRLLAAFGADRLPLAAEITFDLRLGLVALAFAVVMGILISVPIAWYNLAGHPAGALASESRGASASLAAKRMRYAFLVAQMGLAFVLLSGAGLLGQSLKRIMEVSPGFRADGILSGQISLPWKAYPNDVARLAFTERLLEELRKQPGVRATGVVTNVPLSGTSGKSAARVMGYMLPPGESLHGIYSYGVDGDYFAALGVTLMEGRFLDAADSRRKGRVCVVDADFARRYWPEGGALGGKLFQGGTVEKGEQAFTVVGVVGAVKQAGLVEDEAQGAVYYPYAYRPDNSFFVVARTSPAPASLGVTLQQVVRTVDPDLPVNDLKSMDARIALSLVARRSPAFLAGLFSGIAVLLTAIGTYGVLSFAVTQRHREIGLRMALGARPEEVRWQFVSLAFRLLSTGTVLGLLGAWLVGSALQAILFRVPAFDPGTLVVTTGILAFVSVLACLLPSERAARISPMEALAEE
jgi:putative ABC transport system permease protein